LQLPSVQGRVFSFSDGSFKDKHGTAAWVIEAESSGNRCTGVNITPGAPSDQSAYRNEVSGLSGIATMVREICAFYHIIAGTVQIGCDGLSALIQCTDADYVVKPTPSHFAFTFRLDNSHSGYASTMSGFHIT